VEQELSRVATRVTQQVPLEMFALFNYLLSVYCIVDSRLFFGSFSFAIVLSAFLGFTTSDYSFCI
jgi:hypothetical protein